MTKISSVCLNVGPNAWTYGVDGQTITAMTTFEMDTDANLVATAKTEKCNDVNSLRSIKLTGGYTDTNGIVWATDPQSVTDLNITVGLIAAGAISGNLTWRDDTNINHTLTSQEIVQLAGGMTLTGKQIYAASWSHKANVDVLTSVSSISSYDITTGW